VERAGLTINLDLPPEDLRVPADQRRLRQVILNLISNAIKYNSPDGQITLTYQVAGQHARIIVEDTGMGIGTELQGQLFQPFQRLGRENTAILGTGIGLSLCREFATLMGGRMGVSSHPGIGSSFWIELPLASEISTVAPAAEQPVVIAGRICESKFAVIEILNSVNRQLFGCEHHRQILGMSMRAELLLADRFAAEPEALDQAATQSNCFGTQILFPDALRGSFQDQIETLLGALPFVFALPQPLSHDRRMIRYSIQFADFGNGFHRLPLAAADLVHHAGNPGDGLFQARTETARAHPHVGEKQEVEEHQAGDEQIADLGESGCEGIGLLEDVFFRNHRHHAPTGLFNGGPCHQMHFATETQGLNTVRTALHGLGQLTGIGTLVQIEIGGLIKFLADGFVVSELGQFGQSEI
jgi:hypothetical protein